MSDEHVKPGELIPIFLGPVKLLVRGLVMLLVALALAKLAVKYLGAG